MAPFSSSSKAADDGGSRSAASQPEKLSTAEVASSTPGDETPLVHAKPTRHQKGPFDHIRALVHAINENDEAMVEAVLLQLSSRRRVLAPLALVVGALVMLFDGLKLLLANWRLTLVQLLPAMWIWVALFDLKFHAFHGNAFHRLTGWELLAAVVGAGVLTAASFYLNSVFAFAVARRGPPQIRPGFTQARQHAVLVVAVGGLIGLMLGAAAFYVDRWGRGWFAISMSIIIGIMMIEYVAVPSRLLQVKPAYSRSDQLKASMVGGAIGAVVCSPPYMIGRVGVLMLGSHILFIPGIFLLAVGATLQVGATSAVKTVKMSSRLRASQHDRS
jgi:hypothetical protein